MNIQAKIHAVYWWQSFDYFHPLTCGNDSGHRPLTTYVNANRDLALMCLDCGYVQEDIPQTVYEAYANREQIEKMYRHLRDTMK